MPSVRLTNLTRLLDPKSWRGASAFLSAMSAFHKGEYRRALNKFDQAMQVGRLRTAEHMVFRAILLSFNNRPAEEALGLYALVASGEFHRDTAEARYAEAFAAYMVAFLTSETDVEARWQEAHRLKPTKGFAARQLWLPDDPYLRFT